MFYVSVLTVLPHVGIRITDGRRFQRGKACQQIWCVLIAMWLLVVLMCGPVGVLREQQVKAFMDKI